jgi:hypothetical protein
MFDEPTTQSVTADEELEMVRKRFKLASYYEALLEQPTFGDDVYTDQYAAQVQAELTEWVKGRMSELVGIRNNPEGFLDDEVQLLKSLAQSLGVNGVKALIFLAERVLNPTPVAVAPPVPRQPAIAVVHPPATHTPDAPEPTEDDEGSSAMSLLAPPPAPAVPVVSPPQVTPSKSRVPTVRRARVPGARAASLAKPVAPQQAETSGASQKRPRKRSADPLAAGKAAVAAAGQAGAGCAPQVSPAPVEATPAPAHQPVPMPKGLAMTMAMENKAGEALRDAKIINTTGGGVF